MVAVPGAAHNGDPAWAVIYGKRDKLTDVLRQENFNNGTLNSLSYMVALNIDVTELFCDIVVFANGMMNTLAKISSKLKTLRYLRGIKLNGMNQLVPVNNSTGMIPYNQPSGGLVPYGFGYGGRYPTGGGIPHILRNGSEIITKYFDTGVREANIPKSELGEHLGSGGNKDVYAYGEDKAVGVLKPGKPSVLVEDELKLLNKLDELGLPTVNAKSVKVEGNPGLLFDRFEQSSKDIAKLQNGKIRLVGESPLLNQKSIDDLTTIRKIMVDKKIKINDLQFLVGKDGSIVVADPLDVIVGEKPSANNLRMIELLIEAAKKNLE